MSKSIWWDRVMFIENIASKIVTLTRFFLTFFFLSKNFSHVRSKIEHDLIEIWANLKYVSRYEKHFGKIRRSETTTDFEFWKSQFLTKEFLWKVNKMWKMWDRRSNIWNITTMNEVKLLCRDNENIGKREDHKEILRKNLVRGIYSIKILKRLTGGCVMKWSPESLNRS